MKCNCTEEVAGKLAAEGLKISDKCLSFRIVNLTLSAHIGFPLQTKDGKKPKRGKPTFLFLSFCPFCGESLKTEKAPAKKEGK